MYWNPAGRRHLIVDRSRRPLRLHLPASACIAAERLRLPRHGLTKCDLADENQQSLADHTTTNEPPPIRQLSAPELLAWIESGTLFERVDVRTEEERAFARIDGSRLFDQAYHDALLRLNRGTRIVFQYHHGVRSQQAAEYFRREGFRSLHNLLGGIDAWSRLVDASVPRY